MNVGPLDQRVTFESKSATQNADYGTEIITWTAFAVVYANVQDTPPSRSESVRQGLAVARNQTRIRYRYRADIDSSMRVVIRGASDRVLQIIAGPAEIGQHEYSEIVCESYSS